MDLGAGPQPDLGGMKPDMGGELTCKSDAQCPMTMFCNPNTMRCGEALTTESCTFDAPCKLPSQVCFEGMCRDGACRDEFECGFGRACLMGVCSQPEWAFSFREEQGADIPGVLQLLEIDENEEEIIYSSQVLLAQSNTSARFKASLDLFAGSNELEALFDQCTIDVGLFQSAEVSAEVPIVEVSSAEVVDGVLTWRGEEALITSGLTQLALRMFVRCIDGRFDALQDLGDESAISLDFTRLSGESRVGFSIRVQVD